MSPRRLLVAVFCVLGGGATSFGQGFHPADPSSPPPAVPGGPQPLTAPPAQPADLGALTLPSLTETARPQTRWYADGELAVLFNTHLHFDGDFGSVQDNNSVFLAPRVYVGRRFAHGGSVRFTYRNLTEVGTTGDEVTTYGDWSSESTFTTNWFDLDYVSREFAPTSWWRFQLEGGGRMVYRYQCWGSEDTYSRYHSSQDFFGGGPHLGLTSNLLLGRSGWALYGRADTAILFGSGEVKSSYEPRRAYPGGWVQSPYSYKSSFDEYQFDLGLQLGLARRWEWRGRALGVCGGFQMDVLTRGNLNGGEHHTFGFVNMGPFFRCEFGF